MAPPTATRMASFAVGGDDVPLCVAPVRGIAVLAAGNRADLLRVTNLSGAVLGEAALPGRALAARISPDRGRLLTTLDVGGGPAQRRAVVHGFGPDMSLISAGAAFSLPEAVADAAWLDDGAIIAVTVEASRVRAVRCPEGARPEPVADWDAAPSDIIVAACNSGGFAALCFRSRHSQSLATWQLPFPPEQPDLISLTFDGHSYRSLAVGEARQCVMYRMFGSAYLDLGWESADTRLVISPDSAFGGDCLAFLSGSGETVTAFLVTPQNKREPWGEPWECGQGARLRVDRDASQTFVTVSGEEAVSVFLLTDYDILETYADEDDRRLAAARRLGELNRADAVPHLARLLVAREEAERETAARVLGEIGTDQAVDALLTAAGRAGDAAARARQVLHLAPSGQLAGAVRRAVDGQRRSAIRGAAVILRDRTDVPATPELCVIVGDPDPGVRSAAAAALAGRADPVSLPTLLAALADPDEATARAAWQGAARITGIDSDGDEPDGAEPATLAATGPFTAAVLRTGRLDRARAEQPGGARVLGLLARALADKQQAREAALNALQGLGHAERHRTTALVAGLLVAELVQASGAADDGAAGAFLRQAADAAAAAAVPEVEWRARTRLGDLSAAAGQWRAADAHYAAAEQVIDRLWARLLGDLDDRFFFADKAALYESAMLCRLRLGHAASALETLEKAKTRFLGDLIARRHAAPRAGLEAVSEAFWRASGQRRPTGALAGGTPASGRSLEIIGVSLDEEAAVGDPFPAALSALLELDSTGNFYSLVTIVRDVWAVAAGLAAGAYAGPDEEIARNAVTDLDDALGDLRAAAGDLGLTEEAIVRYLNAGEALHGLAVEPERNYGWLLTEFGDSPVRGYATEEQEYEPFIDALREAASFVTGRVAVTAVSGAGEAAVTAWQDNGNYPVPRFAAAVPADPAAAAGADMTSRAAATTALTAVTERHWAYVARVARGETSGLREAAGLVRPEPGTALVEFAVTTAGTVTYAVTAGGDLDADPLPAVDGWAAPAVFTAPAVTAAELTSRLTGPGGWKAAYDRRAYDGGAAWRTALDSALSWLHAELFQPLEPWLRARGVKRLLVVPHRGLHLLPVTAWWCRRGGRRRYVLDDYEVCFAPSLTLLQICHERRGQPGVPGRPLALLDPTGDLPLTRLDALALDAGLTPDRVLAGSAATVAQWRAAGADASPAHYAGHGRYDWGEPLGSSIPMHDGALTLGEMFDNEMPIRPAAEISLLGCETSMTDPRDPADEYLGLASGFLFAGASSVLSTLWAVQEAPAMLLSARYYSERQRGARPPTALRAAQRWLRGAGPADIRRTLNRADDLERLGLLNDALRNTLPRIRQPARPWERRPFAHPIVWGAYTVTAD